MKYSYKGTEIYVSNYLGDKDIFCTVINDDGKEYPFAVRFLPIRFSRAKADEDLAAFAAERNLQPLDFSFVLDSNCCLFTC